MHVTADTPTHRTRDEPKRGFMRLTRRIISTLILGRAAVMRWLILLLAAASISTIPPAGPAFAQNPQDGYTGPKMRIAVMNLSGTALTAQTTTQSTATTTTVALPPPSDFARG